MFDLIWLRKRHFCCGHKVLKQQLPDTTYKTVGVIEEAMLGASRGFFLFHLLQVVVFIFDVFTGSEGEDGDPKTRDGVAGVAERAKEPTLSQLSGEVFFGRK